MKKPTRFLRISLRTLLALVTILCLWFGRISMAARTQRETVAWVLKNGGAVGYDWQDRKAGGVPGPGWLRSFLGDDYFQTAVRARLTHVRGMDVTPVFRLRRLRALDLTSDGLSDLTALSSLRQLRELVLTDNELADIAPLARLTHLTSLTLDYNSIHDVSPLASLKGLKKLNLEHNEISEVRPLTELPKLRRLNIVANPIRDPAPLFKLGQLATLTLGRNGFSDEQAGALIDALPGTSVEERTLPASLREP